jgi:hypothetical protein
MELGFILDDIRKLQEGLFRNWEYVVPKNPEDLLYDFYFMSWLDSIGYGGAEHNWDDLLPELEKAINIVIPSLRKHMLKAVSWSLACEFRHIFDTFTFHDHIKEGGVIDEVSDPMVYKFIRYYVYYMGKEQSYFKIPLDPEPPDIPDEDVEKVVTTSFLVMNKNEGDSERLRSFNCVNKSLLALNGNSVLFGEACVSMYSLPGWSGSYGGPKWAECAKRFTELAQPGLNRQEQSKWIDQLYDVQHNTGALLNKVKFYYSYSSQFAWLQRALDWKSEVTDPRAYYDRVSYSLQPVVAYVVKNRQVGHRTTGFLPSDPETRMKGVGGETWDYSPGGEMGSIEDFRNKPEGEKAFKHPHKKSFTPKATTPPAPKPEEPYF